MSQKVPRTLFEINYYLKLKLIVILSMHFLPFRFFSTYLEWCARFLYKQHFLSTQPQVLLNSFMNSASDVASVLFTAHNHHHTETHFPFSIFVICLGLVLLTS